MAKKKKYDSENGVWRTIGGRRVFIRTGQSLSSAMKESGKFNNSIKKSMQKVAKQYEQDKKEGKVAERLKENEENEKKIRNEAVDKNDYINKNKQYEEMKKRVNEQYEKDIEDARMTGNDKLEESAKKARAEQLRDIDKMQKENRKEYELYKRAKENPDSIDPMTENSTDWEALDKKYSGRYEKERDAYESKVFGSDVTKADEQMKKTFGEDFKYDEEKKYVKTLSGEYEKDNKGRKVTQKEYDDFRQAYRDGKISKEDYRNDNYGALKKEFDESNLKPSSIYAKSELKTKEDFIERHKQLELSKDRVNKQYELDIKDARMTGNDRLEKAAKEGRIQQLKDIDRLQKENIEKYRKFNNEFHYAGEELYSDDPNRFGDKLRKYNNKMNPSKNDALNKVKNNRIVENVKSGDRFYEIGNGQWRSEKDGYDYYIDFNSSNIDNPKYRDVASGRIINTNPRADNYWDYEGNGLKSKYKGTIDYLQKTTNMNNSEILELLKRIDEDKK